MSTYVLVHGASCNGAILEDVAQVIRAEGHEVHCPTTRGNLPGAYEDVTLSDAVASIVAYLEENGLSDVILVGHSWGGMVISGVYNAVPDRIRRLVYWNAFVPNSGESLIDLVPPHYADMFSGMAAESGNNSIGFPPPVLREAFMNCATDEQFQATNAKLVPQAFGTFSEKIQLKANPADWPVGKSYVNATEDTALPHSHGWHPRMSEKLGLFRLIQLPGDHMAMVTDPEGIGRALIMAGRD